MKQSKVSIILVNYNSALHTKECVESLLSLNYENYDIYVVDNNSSDNTLKDALFIYEDNPKIHIIYNDNNVGFSAGNNIAIKKALEFESEYVLLLNNDTVVDKNFLLIMLEETKKKTNIGITTCKIMMYYNRSQCWYAGGYLDKNGSAKIQYEDNDTVTDNYTFASGCCMLISNKVIHNLGYMSEKYFLYFEDTDFCKKIINSGYKILYCGNSVIYHKESVSTQKRSKLYSYYFSRNRLIYIRCNFTNKEKPYAYIYSLLWIIKKCIVREFKLIGAMHGIADAILGKTGKIN